MQSLNPDTRLTRDEAAAALTAHGYRTSSKTLATKASRGGGPPFRHWGPRVFYVWGELLPWAEAQMGKLQYTTEK
jgi:hypothetical protein